MSARHQNAFRRIELETSADSAGRLQQRKDGVNGSCVGQHQLITVTGEDEDPPSVDDVARERDASSNAAATDTQRQARLPPSDVTERRALELRRRVRAENDGDFSRRVGPDVTLDWLNAHCVVIKQHLIGVN